MDASAGQGDGSHRLLHGLVTPPGSAPPEHARPGLAMREPPGRSPLGDVPYPGHGHEDRGERGTSAPPLGVTAAAYMAAAVDAPTYSALRGESDPGPVYAGMDGPFEEEADPASERRAEECNAATGYELSTMTRVPEAIGGGITIHEDVRRHHPEVTARLEALALEHASVFLQQFLPEDRSYTIVHIPGVTNVPADELSRLPGIIPSDLELNREHTAKVAA